MDDTLFPLPPASTPATDAAPAEVRLRRPNRQQLELRSADLDGLRPVDHRARVVWHFVEGLDLGPLYAQVKAVDGHAGRPAIDPAILMALWLYATLQGVGSARALARLAEEYDAYRWLCGGVAVNYHTLADFRGSTGEYLDEVLITSVAALMAEGLVQLQRVAHDGVKVRASAGAGSFRRGARLAQMLGEATAQVDALKREVHGDPGASVRRIAAARQRAATEQLQRVTRALAQLPAVVRYGRGPAEVLADGGYVALRDIRALEGPAGGCRVYAPPEGFARARAGARLAAAP